MTRTKYKVYKVYFVLNLGWEVSVLERLDLAWRRFADRHPLIIVVVEVGGIVALIFLAKELLLN